MKRFLAIALLLLSFKSFAISDITCLAENIHREARGESLLGQIAVGLVVLNRVKAKGFPKSICKVVFQPNQFSWTAGFDNIYRASPMSRLVAAKVISGEYKMPGFTATHYHNLTVKPNWNNLRKDRVIQNHVFYREKS